MIHRIILLTLFITTITTITTAQKTTGVVTFECTKVEGGGMQAMLLQNSTQTIAFGKHTTLLDFNAMNGTVTTKIYNNTQSKKTTLLMSVPFMGKYKVNMTEEEAKEYRGEPVKLDITYKKKSTKKILGYTCHKAIVKTKESSIVLYVTDKIKPKQSPFSNMFPDLKGFPLEFQSNRGETKMTFKAKKITKIKKDTFKYSSKGYEELTAEEFKKRMGDRK